MTIAVCPFDSTSRGPGASAGAAVLARRLRARGADTWHFHQVACDTKSSAIYCRLIRAAARQHAPRFAIGGDHLITFPLVEELASRQPLRLVVLDAHHDAYAHPLLSHWSLFHFTRAELGVPTLVVGARWELESSTVDVISADALAAHGVAWCAQKIREFVAGSAWYLSVDVDVVAPAELAAVSSPVAGGPSAGVVAALVREALALGPIAADIVEYNPLLDDRELSGLQALEPILQAFREWL
jgi:arginase family enzyme